MLLFLILITSKVAFFTDNRLDVTELVPPDNLVSLD